MKRQLYILTSLLFFTILQAQEASDAMRFAQTNLGGTARFKSMSGAFGALGGDLSAINVNPAGSAIFNHNEIGFTLNNRNTKNQTTYFGTQVNSSDNSFNFGQFGSVWTFKNQDPRGEWTKLAFSINYEDVNDFDNFVYAVGTNPTKSIADYFLSYANGVPLNIIKDNYFEYLSFREQQAYLGYNGYIINPNSIDPTENQYVSNLAPTNNFHQENSVYSYGYNGKLNFNFASAYKNKYYFGLNLNSHFTDFTRNSSFYESYYNAPNFDPTKGVQYVRFDNNLHTWGSGFSFQIGAIAKVTKEARFGFSYESPTWYHLYDEQRQTLLVNCPDCGQEGNPFYADPNIVMIYPGYTVQTPSKFNGSFAYIFSKQGLISLDYTFKDYSSTKLKPENDFNNFNREINATFAQTSEVRAGAEYRIQNFSLRGGYRFEQSPYKNKSTIGDLNGYSTGFGYNFGPMKFDFAYNFSKRNSQQPFFSQGLNDPALIKTKYNDFSFSLMFLF